MHSLTHGKCTCVAAAVDRRRLVLVVEQPDDMLRAFNASLRLRTPLDAMFMTAYILNVSTT